MTSKRNTQTRRADGKPETAVDKRFFDLRESGYAGPVGRDGRRSTDPQVLGIFAAVRRGCK